MTNQVILVGANPIVRLFDGDAVTVFASVWVVDWSPHGSGTVLVLWHDGRVRVLGADAALAAWVADDFTRHFPEAEGLVWRRGEVEPEPVTVALDLARGLTVSAGNVTIAASGVLDRRSFATDSFTLEERPHGLSLVLAPVSHASVHIDGEPVPGGVRRSGTEERPSSSAFLTAAEVWTHPEPETDLTPRQLGSRFRCEDRGMEYVNLGRTGLKVSPLCLGTMNFGPVTDETDSHAIMDSALEHGIQFFDTADVYGWQRGEGITEKILGSWFAKGGDRRESVVLATKAYGSMGDGPNDRGLSARHLISACEASLKRMRTDHIDLYQMHHVDRSTPWEEIWQAMDLLVSQGKVRYVGSSNFAGWHLVAAQEAANRRNSLGLVSEQCLYNLMARTVELEVLPAAEAYGIGILPWSPLNGGALAGALRKLAEGRAGRSGEGHGAERVEQHREQLAAWEEFCAELGHDPANVGLAWLLSRPAVTAPIVGPRTVEQLDGTLGCLDITLDEARLARLDELFPPVGKGGPGPEAWGW